MTYEADISIIDGDLIESVACFGDCTPLLLGSRIVQFYREMGKSSFTDVLIRGARASGWIDFGRVVAPASIVVRADPMFRYMIDVQHETLTISTKDSRVTVPLLEGAPDRSLHHAYGLQWAAPPVPVPALQARRHAAVRGQVVSSLPNHLDADRVSKQINEAMAKCCELPHVETPRPRKWLVGGRIARNNDPVVHIGDALVRLPAGPLATPRSRLFASSEYGDTISIDLSKFEFPWEGLMPRSDWLLWFEHLVSSVSRNYSDVVATSQHDRPDYCAVSTRPRRLEQEGIVVQAVTFDLLHLLPLAS